MLLLEEHVWALFFFEPCRHCIRRLMGAINDTFPRRHIGSRRLLGYGNQTIGNSFNDICKQSAKCKCIRAIGLICMHSSIEVSSRITRCVSFEAAPRYLVSSGFEGPR